MRRQRTVSLAIACFLLGICVACAQAFLATAPTPRATSGVTNETTPVAIAPVSLPTSPPAREAALPPATAALLASAPGKNLINPPRGDVRLLVISDLNGPYGSLEYDPEVDRAIQLVPYWQPDLVVCSGDMVAGQDITLTKERLRAMWAAFDDRVAKPLRQMKMPYGFTVGNHDASSARGSSGKFLFQAERDATAEFWRDPSHDPGVQFVDRFEFPFYYTFEHRGIFFLVWDGSSHIIPPEKLAWVEAALSSPKAQQAKMRVLLGHLPLYAVAVGRNEPAEVMENADRLRAMLEKYGVHTYISGHHHAYYPAHRGKLQLLHTGILGAGPRPLIDSNLPPRKTLTVVDVTFDRPELTTYTTFDMRTFARIEYEELPRLLMGHNGVVLRRDVAALTASEQATCEQRLGRDRCQP